MATKNMKRIAPNLKASTVRRLARAGVTMKSIAQAYGFCNVQALYARFGSQIVGIAKRGRPAKQVAI
jgi:transposase-like protein